MNNENTFDFSKYLATPEQLSMPEENTQNDSPEGFDFQKYTQKEPETNFEASVRNISRTGSRVAESIVGAPGDIVQAVKTGAEYLPKLDKKDPNLIQKAGRQFAKSLIAPVPLPDKMDKFTDKYINFIEKSGSELLELLPTSDYLKDGMEELTGGYTKPQGSSEEFSDKIASLVPTLVNPSRAFSGVANFFRNVGMSIAKATAVKGSGKAAKALGATDNQVAAVETGVLFLAGLTNKQSAEQFVSEQYREARGSIPPNAIMRTSNIERSLLGVERELTRGIPTTTKTEVLRSVNALQEKVRPGRMRVDELIQSYHDINERLGSKKLFDELNTSQRRLLRNRYDLLKNEVRNEIQTYGRTNPEFLTQWTEANRSYQTIAESKRVSNFIQSKIGTIPKHLVGSVALDVFLGSPKSTVSLIGAYGMLKGSELMYKIFNDRNLRQHYMRVVTSATNENLPAMVKNLNLLDYGLTKTLENEKDRPKDKKN